MNAITIFIFPYGIVQDLCKWMNEDRGKAGTPVSVRDSRKKFSEDQPVLDTTVQNKLNHVINDTQTFKYFKVLSIKGHFMLSKAFSKSMKVKDQEFVLYLHTWWCFLWAWYFHQYFPYYIFPKTCLIAIDNLRKSFSEDWQIHLS